MTMGERSNGEDFLDAYRAAFEAFDGPAIADLFSYPCQITSDAGEIAVTTVPSREAWLPQIERLLAAYRALDVRSAEVSELQVIDFTPRLAQAAVRWSLVGGEGARIYDFDASYTLADLGRSARIKLSPTTRLPVLEPLLSVSGSDDRGVHGDRRRARRGQARRVTGESSGIERKPRFQGFKAPLPVPLRGRASSARASVLMSKPRGCGASM